jgi:GNAT superfamily N-acetyltransferase
MFIFCALYALLLSCSTICFAEAITFHTYRGKDVIAQAHHWPHLSVALTYDYPYLYVGKAEDEDVEQFSTDGSVAVLAKDGEQVIGIAIGKPVDSEKGHSKMVCPLVQQHARYQYGKAIYVVEVLVDTPYQRQGIARRMMEYFEHESGLLGYADMYLVTVERSANHPFKTVDVVDLDVIWKRLQFSKTHLSKAALWPTRCGVPGNEFVAPVDNMLRLWHKRITCR